LNNERNEPRQDRDVDVRKPRPREKFKIVESINEPMVGVEACQDRLGSVQEKDKINCRGLSMSFVMRKVSVSTVSIQCLPRNFR
jgi:hypothetical protein